MIYSNKIVPQLNYTLQKTVEPAYNVAINRGYFDWMPRLPAGRSAILRNLRRVKIQRQDKS
jgi:hypothetical protein